MWKLVENSIEGYNKDRQAEHFIHVLSVYTTPVRFNTMRHTGIQVNHKRRTSTRDRDIHNSPHGLDRHRLEQVPPPPCGAYTESSGGEHRQRLGAVWLSIGRGARLLSQTNRLTDYRARGEKMFAISEIK